MTAPVLVTGADGALGQAVVSALEATPFPVIIHAGRSDGDLTDENACQALVAQHKPRAVINAAGRTYGDVAELWAANLLIPVRLADAIAGAGSGTRLVIVGSAAEYGLAAHAGLRLREDAPCRPNSDYGLSKLAAGRAVDAMGIDHCIGRVFNLIDPHAHSRALLPRVKAAIDAGAPLPPDAGAVRDWVTLYFAGRALVALALADSPPAVVNICSGEGRSAASMLGIAPEMQPTAESWSVGDPSLLASSLGLRADGS